MQVGFGLLRLCVSARKAMGAVLERCDICYSGEPSAASPISCCQQLLPCLVAQTCQERKAYCGMPSLHQRSCCTATCFHAAGLMA